MIDVHTAIEIAKKHRKFTPEILYISSVRDTGDGYIISIDRKDGIVIFGNNPVFVFKDTGKLQGFPLNVDEFYRKLENSKEVEFQDDEQQPPIAANHYFSPEQINTLESLGITPDVKKWSDDDYVRAEDLVGNLYTDAAKEHGIDSMETLFYESLFYKIVAL